MDAAACCILYLTVSMISEGKQVRKQFFPNQNIIPDIIHGNEGIIWSALNIR